MIFKADFTQLSRFEVKFIWVENLEIPGIQPKYNKYIFFIHLQSFIKPIVMRLKFSFLRQVSGIKYLNQMSTYHLAGDDSQIT